jgi:carboxylesterase
MIKQFAKLAEKAVEDAVEKTVDRAKSILFADPKLLFEEERHLVNQPFFFEGTNGKGVLLVHGWTSTAYEVRRLGKYLNENGYTVSGIMLTGHGTFPEDIEGVKWQTWVDDVRKGYGQLKQSCDKAYIAGTSIGGSMAMIIAKENPEIDGLILMATPYKIKLEKLIKFLALGMLFFGKRYNVKVYPPTFGAATTITRVISYQKYSIKSALETKGLVEEARKNLEKIKQPCFLLQSTSDHVVGRNSLEIIYRKIGSRIKRKKYIKRAYHTFISDIKNEHVFRDILDFLDEN